MVRLMVRFMVRIRVSFGLGLVPCLWLGLELAFVLLLA
jgi:hypothetical protein